VISSLQALFPLLNSMLVDMDYHSTPEIMFLVAQVVLIKLSHSLC
jgi:hypothetical protein